MTPAQTKRLLSLHRKAMEASQRYWRAERGTEHKTELSYKLDEAEKAFQACVEALKDGGL